MATNVITPDNLGDEFDIGVAEANKIHVVSMTGATAGTAGDDGLVPVPAAGDEGKYLGGDGTWSDPGLNVDEGWRVAGAAGSGGSAAEPTRADSISVLDVLQHLGDILVGGSVGDIPREKLHIIGEMFIEAFATQEFQIHLYNNAGVADHRYFVIGHRAATPSEDFGYIRITPLDDAGNALASGTAFDRFGNLIVNHGAKPSNNGAKQNLVWRDGMGIAKAVAPTAPWDANCVHSWAIGGELFVMDGAGNVTQLSSHPEVAYELMPPPKWLENPRYDWGYNIFTRVLTGALLLGSESRYFSADIDSGEYEVRDETGKVLSSGVDKRLLYGSNHAPDVEFDSVESTDERVAIFGKRAG